jgi:hypothetical protein
MNVASSLGTHENAQKSSDMSPQQPKADEQRQNVIEEQNSVWQDLESRQLSILPTLKPEMARRENVCGRM